MERYCLTLDMRDDPELMRQYDEQHKAVWPEIIESIKQAGIFNMEVYRLGTRLFMIMETEDGFSFENKQLMDENNKTVQEWENLMWKYQRPFTGASKGEKWVLMNRIFKLTDY